MKYYFVTLSYCFGTFLMFWDISNVLEHFKVLGNQCWKTIFKIIYNNLEHFWLFWWHVLATKYRIQFVSKILKLVPLCSLEEHLFSKALKTHLYYNLMSCVKTKGLENMQIFQREQKKEMKFHYLDWYASWRFQC